MGKSMIKNTLYKFFLSTFSVIIPVIVGPYINGLINEQQYGIYNTAVGILPFFIMFASFGIYNFGVREISKVRDDKKKLASLFTNLFVFGVITNIVVSIAYLCYVLFWVDAPKQAIFMVMIVQILANTFMVEWMNEAVENYGFITVKTVIIRIVSTVFVFLVITKPEHALLYAVINSLTILANNVVSFIYVKKSVKFRFSDLHLAKYIKPLFLLLLISNVNILFTQLDRIMLPYFVGDMASTQYALPSNLINMIVITMMSLITVSIPRLNYYISQNQVKNYLDLLNKSSRSYFLLIFPCCVGLFCLGYEVMYLYGTAKYVDSYPVLQVFAIRFIFTCVHTIFANQILYIYKKEKQLVLMMLVGGVANTILKFALVYLDWLTPVSAIFTTMIAEIIMLAVMYYYIRAVMKIEFNIFDMQNMKYLYLSMPFLPIVYAIKLLNLGVLYTSIIAVAVCGGYYFLSLILTKDKILFFYIDKIKAKLKK